MHGRQHEYRGNDVMTGLLRFMEKDQLGRRPGWKLIFSSGVILLSAVAGNYSDLQIMVSLPGKCYAETVLLYLAQTGFMVPLILLSAAFFSSTQFYEDKTSGMLTFILLRIPVKIYLLEKVIACGLSAFFCVTLAAAAPLGWLMAALPGSSLQLSLFIITEYAAAAAFWCMVGLMISAFIQNYYVVIAGPFVLSYTIGRVCYSLLPDEMNPNNYMQSLLLFRVPAEDRWTIFLQGILLFAVLSVMAGSVFVFAAKRKLYHEI